MKTVEFFERLQNTYLSGKKLVDVSDDMATLWDTLMAQKEYIALRRISEQDDVFDMTTLRKIACRIVRELPVRGNLTTWDMVPEDDRHDWQGQEAIQIAERYINGNATAEELQDGYDCAEWASEQACSSFIRELNELIKFACAADYCELSEVFRAYIQTSEVDEPAEKLFSLINEYGNPFKKGE